MVNRIPFGVDEWYHCFTRGVDKRRTFQSTSDYKRFLQILYLSNSDQATQRSNFLTMQHEKILSQKRGQPLVSIGAYCIMPNHFHILLQEIKEGGIARFMQKVGISYAMYFNIKNQRIGNLFVKPFRSRHIADDQYLRYVAQYIHLNPAELFDRNWKSAGAKNIQKMDADLRKYPYSSLYDYYEVVRPERSILSPQAMDVISDDLPSLASVLAEAAEYYSEIKLV